MIALLILFAVIATAMVTINAALLALVVYLSRRCKRALRAVDALNNAVYSLSVDKAYLIAQQKPSLLWVDKGRDAMH
jgi:uncharacterized protein YoxC